MLSAENFCGSGTLIRESHFRELVIAYVSTGNRTGNFNCKLTVKEQKCDCGWSASSRISNGQQAAANEFPSMAALKDRTSNLQSFCGGVIGEYPRLMADKHYIKEKQTNAKNLIVTLEDILC